MLRFQTSLVFSPPLQHGCPGWAEGVFSPKTCLSLGAGGDVAKPGTLTPGRTEVKELLEIISLMPEVGCVGVCKKHIHVLASRAYECDLFGNRVFADVKK